MTGIDVVKAALRSTQSVLTTYISDLNDADLLIRPVANANHIAWQLGHLIKAERHLVLAQLPDATMPELPNGFGEAHNDNRAKQEDTTGFLSKADYAKLFSDVRAATIAAVETLTDADLDTPTKGPMAPFAPRLGDLFLLIANHTLMHGGQFIIVRRIQGKPVLI